MDKISFNELLFDYPIDKIPYSELIRTREWFDKREIILRRDGHHCRECGNYETIEHFDPPSKRTVHFWFLEDKLTYVKREDGTYSEEMVPQIKIADRQYVMHVHHKYYVLNKFPWEYDDDALITLCNWCHWNFHETNIVPVYKTSDKLEQAELTICDRCHGAGRFPEYSHVDNGICFKCRGAKFTELIRI